MTILESILKALRAAASYNYEQAAPRVILWPDEERLWTQCIESLRASYPSLWSLGDYTPDKGTGPAVWLRFQLEMYTEEDIPGIYLPSIYLRCNFKGNSGRRRIVKTGPPLRFYRVRMAGSGLTWLPIKKRIMPSRNAY